MKWCLLSSDIFYNFHFNLEGKKRRGPNCDWKEFLIVIIHFQFFFLFTRIEKKSIQNKKQQRTKLFRHGIWYCRGSLQHSSLTAMWYHHVELMYNEFVENLLSVVKLLCYHSVQWKFWNLIDWWQLEAHLVLQFSCSGSVGIQQ